ncbi:MAG: NnrS family protein [Halospina sp.]
MAEPINTPPRLSPVTLFSYPFRIFFLSLAIQAVVSVPLWVGAVTGRLELPLAIPALAWHQHEMVFAWLQAAIAGFLLTAVCVWTGTTRTHGWPLAGLWIPVALWLLAASRFGAIPETVWAHATGLGAMGGLILGVISRVVLGHTGRTLTLPRRMVTAFMMIHLGALIRVATGAGGMAWQTGISVSAVLWMLAFGLFLFRYTGILMRPRVDGKPG